MRWAAAALRNAGSLDSLAASSNEFRIKTLGSNATVIQTPSQSKVYAAREKVSVLGGKVECPER